MAGSVRLLVVSVLVPVNRPKPAAEGCSDNYCMKSALLHVYWQNLIDDLKGDLAGNFLRLCLYLMLPQEEYDARCLRYALVINNPKRP